MYGLIPYDIFAMNFDIKRETSAPRKPNIAENASSPPYPFPRLIHSTFSRRKRIAPNSTTTARFVRTKRPIRLNIFIVFSLYK